MVYTTYPLPETILLLSKPEINGYFSFGQRILQNTFDGIESVVMPHQLSQLWRVPFLGSLIMRPLDQSSEMMSLFQMLNRSVSTLVGVVRSALSIPAWMVSISAAFPFLSALMAHLTSALVGGLMSMSRTSTAGGGLAGSSGAGL